MLRTRTALLAAGTALAVAAVPAPALAKSKTKSYKIKSGTTKLTFAQAALDKLGGFGITVGAQAPASGSAPVLSFPVSGGKVKLKGKKIVSGSLAHKGGLVLNAPAAAIPILNPSVKLKSKTGSLSGTVGGAPSSLGKVDLSHAKVKLTKSGGTLSGVKITLTSDAAALLTTLTQAPPPGFVAGDPVGTATVKVKFKK